MEGGEAIELTAELESEDARADELINHWSTPQLEAQGINRDSCESRNEDGITVVWTDGASRNNQDARVRRAGCGIFYGTAHDFNFSCILPGLVQSNQRAELLAIVLALNRDPRSLELRTDSQYVYDGACAWHSWCERGWRGANADLWLRFSHAIAARPVVYTNFTKVEGHALTLMCNLGACLLMINGEMTERMFMLVQTLTGMLFLILCSGFLLSGTLRQQALTK